MTTQEVEPLASPVAPEPPRASGAREQGYWSAALRALLHDWTSVIGLVLVAILCLCALLAPLLAPSDPDFLHREGLTLEGRPQGPTSEFPLGTDELGRDELSRILYGARVSLFIGVGGTALAALVGILVGSLAGMSTGPLQSLLMRAVDIVLSLPTLLMAIALLAVTRPTVLTLLLIVAVTFGAGLSRIVFSQVTSLREREFVLAARASGVRTGPIMVRHILPHILPSVLVVSTLSVATVIMFEAALSYVGIGVQPPQPSWGNMISAGQSNLLSSPHLVAFPAGVLVVTMVGFALLGDGLRDVLDPTLDRRRTSMRTGVR